MIELCKTFKSYRTDFIEIIVENIVNFDTELVAGDEWVHKPFPNDSTILEMRDMTDSSKNELAHKLDTLLS